METPPPPRYLEHDLILFLVETKVFSGSSEKQQEVRVSLSAPQAGQQLEGDGPLSHDWLVGELSESPARHCPASLKPALALSGLLCPLHVVHTALQEDSGDQIEREYPTGKEQVAGGDHPF